MWASAQYKGKDGATIDATYARNWNASSGACPRFYTDTASREIYKYMLWKVMTRQNTYTNLAYNEDPTIMQWELCNGCRCPLAPTDWGDTAARGRGDEMQGWIEEMAAYAKALSPRQLVALGSEGFLCSGTDCSHADSGFSTSPILAEWAGSQGVDFVRNNEPSNLDVAVYHARPELWGASARHKTGYGQNKVFDPNIELLNEWMLAHETTRLRKPIILESFAAPSPPTTYANDHSARSIRFENILNRVVESHRTAAALFWKLGTGVWKLRLDGNLGAWLRRVGTVGQVGADVAGGVGLDDVGGGSVGDRASLRDGVEAAAEGEQRRSDGTPDPGS